MNNCRRAQLLDELEDALAVPDVELVMDETGNLANQSLLIQSGISQGPKKNLPLIVVDPMDLAAVVGKLQASFGADQAEEPVTRMVFKSGTVLLGSGNWPFVAIAPSPSLPVSALGMVG